MAFDQPEIHASDDAELNAKLFASRDRARADFPYFCRTFLKIIPKEESVPMTGEKLAPIIPFKWNQAQRYVWSFLKRRLQQQIQPRMVIVKARQVGISTMACAWLFWQLWRGQYVTCLIAAQHKSALQKMLETLNLFYESFPSDYRPVLRDRFVQDGRIPKHEVFFSDRNSWLLIAAAKNVESGRAQSIKHFLATEVASYPEPEEFFGAFLPSMGSSPEKSGWFESSPKSGYYADKYKRAKLSKVEDAIFIEWWRMNELYVTPIIKGKSLWGERVSFSPEERHEQEICSKLAAKVGLPPVSDEQMLWRQIVIERDYDGDVEFFNQEYPRDDQTAFERNLLSAFRSSAALVRESVENAPDYEAGWIESDNYTDPMKEAVTQWLPDKGEVIDQDREPGWFVWEHPRVGHVYCIGSDVADESDDPHNDSAYSTAFVFCVSCGAQAGSWRGKPDPHDLGDELAKGGYYWNEAMINLEWNNMGITTADRLRKYIMYPNLYRWPHMDDDKLTKKIGWYTNPQTKQLMINDFRFALKTGKMKIYDEGMRWELNNYRLEEGHYFPNAGATADRIIAGALAWLCVAQIPELTDTFNSGESRRAMASDGQAAAYLKENPAAIPPPGLPDELGELEGQDVEDVWAATMLGAEA